MATNNKDDRGFWEGYWFAQKRYGYGAEPLTAAGRVATFAYVALIAVIVLILSPDEAKIVASAILTIGYLILVWKKTEGGWRWRWGKEDK